MADATAAAGTKLHHPNAGGAKIVTALANPVDYFEATFSAQAGVPSGLDVPIAIPERLAALETDAVDHAVPGDEGTGRPWPGVGAAAQGDAGEAFRRPRGHAP